MKKQSLPFLITLNFWCKDTTVCAHGGIFSDFYSSEAYFLDLHQQRAQKRGGI